MEIPDCLAATLVDSNYADVLESIAQQDHPVTDLAFIQG